MGAGSNNLRKRVSFNLAIIFSTVNAIRSNHYLSYSKSGKRYCSKAHQLDKGADKATNNNLR